MKVSTRLDEAKATCPRGHDKRVVGITERYYCRACDDERHSREYEERTRHIPKSTETPFYPPGLSYERAECQSCGLRKQMPVGDEVCGTCLVTPKYRGES